MICALLSDARSNITTITAAVEKRCPDDLRKPQSNETEVGAEAEAVIALENSNAAFDEIHTAFQIINGILLVVTVAGRFVAPLRVVAIPAAVARTNVAQLMTRINIQRAANEDRIFELQRQIQLRRAA